MGRKNRESGLHLIKRPGSKFWYVQGTLFGERVRESTQTESREEAEIVKAKLVDTIKKIHLYGERSKVDFNTCAAKYIREASIKSLDRDDIILSSSIYSHPQVTQDTRLLFSYFIFFKFYLR